ncbi:Hypothetical protein Pla110_03430 [Polystyrenella longa]|uniref:Uncharacterized protein n=1 Tax=Polystyrenella longa TaxID=2528007 RepID=A0A518CHC8_9PLAN|nr:hypothetical protein [Polystyrenella longa]QDU78639.1 Hypothetical protein Pla110_03430 [Polystyrenella longa]
MGIIIGMDEAGYGPNLGPLVISVVGWKSVASPRETDFWTLFEPIVTQKFKRNETRVHVGDSKAVYTPGRGVKQLERSVLSFLGLVGQFPSSFRQLIEFVSPHTLDEFALEPWFANSDLELPLKNEAVEIEQTAHRWRTLCEECQLEPLLMRSDVVGTVRFNQEVERHQSKGVVLSEATISLLQKVWEPVRQETCWIVGDKHGGRNRYDDLLGPLAGDSMILRREEGTQRSEYRIDQTDIRFQTKAESHFSVALASMISKYVREVSMEVFNRYWQTHRPDLKPTKGYPTDARRFQTEVADLQRELGISDECFWRAR